MSKHIDINIEKYDATEFEKEQLPFTQICNKVIQNIDNIQAAFMWIYLQSMPPTWTPNKFHLMSHFQISERTYQRHMSYLADCNLVSYTRKRNKNGTLGAVRLVVHNGSKYTPALGSDHTAKICIVDFNHTANLPQCGGTTPVADDDHINKQTSIKEKEKIINKPPISPRGGSGGFGISQMLNNNPHEIPEAVLADWMEVRKAKRAKMTETAWNHVNSNVEKLKAKGLEPLFCFVTAVGRSWAGMETRFFDEYLPQVDKEAEKRKIMEREAKAAQEKRQEIAASKNFKNIVAQAKTKQQRDAEWEANRIAMNMTVTEYSAYVLNKARVPEDNI